MNLRVAVLALAALALGAVPDAAAYRQLDSQVVLQRYALALDAVPAPKTVVFRYVVSQAGPNNVEQRHIVYRSGLDVRDETLAVDGVALVRKIVRFSQREDRYAIERTAPRAAGYQLLFLQAIKDGHHLDYEYELTPLIRTQAAWIDRMTIDGVKFLPRALHFHTNGAEATGTGEIEYGSAAKYWVPLVATASATVDGKPARERIVFSDYRFPDDLPQSAFQSPKPLPAMTLPPI